MQVDFLAQVMTSGSAGHGRHSTRVTSGAQAAPQHLTFRNECARHPQILKVTALLAVMLHRFTDAACRELLPDRSLQLQIAFSVSTLILTRVTVQS